MRFYGVRARPHTLPMVKPAPVEPQYWSRITFCTCESLRLVSYKKVRSFEEPFIQSCS